MTPTWNPGLSMDNEVIDSHHKELFALISMLDKAVQQQDALHIEELLRFLDEYVLEHFEEEEELMDSTDFEGVHHHKTDHHYFREVVKNLRDDFDKGVFKTHLVFRIRQLIDKLVVHILTVDSQLASHLHRHRKV